MVAVLVTVVMLVAHANAFALDAASSPIAGSSTPRPMT
jgi:hypothetical protein